MYGGHIVNDFDRKMCNTYLDFFMKDELLDETEMYPYNDDEKALSFMCPAPTQYDKYLEHIEFALTQDTPIAFGLHPNAEIDFRTTQSNRILITVLELQDRVAASGEGAMSPDEVAAATTADILDRFGEKKFDVEDIARSLEEQGPYQNVFMQEMDVMNILLTEIMRSLKELQLGFAGELTMSDAMDALKNSLYLDRIPGAWQKRAWPSMRPLSSWLVDFNLRLVQLEEWQNNPADIPKVRIIHKSFYNNAVFLSSTFPIVFTGYLAVWTIQPSVLPHCDLPGHGAEEPVGTRQARHLDGCHQEALRGGGGRYLSRWRLYLRPERAGRSLGRQRRHFGTLQAEGDVLQDAYHQRQGSGCGQGRCLHRRLCVPHLQDRVQRPYLRLLRPAKDQV